MISSIYQDNTPFYNPDTDEIEVVDPTHPLFGRSFTIVSIARQPKGPANILVRYNELMQLQIPIAATNLRAPNLDQARTKLNLSAITELLTIATDCEALSCPSTLEIFGNESQKTCNSTSCKTSHSSVRR